MKRNWIQIRGTDYVFQFFLPNKRMELNRNEDVFEKPVRSVFSLTVPALLFTLLFLSVLPSAWRNTGRVLRDTPG